VLFNRDKWSLVSIQLHWLTQESTFDVDNGDLTCLSVTLTGPFERFARMFNQSMCGKGGEIQQNHAAKIAHGKHDCLTLSGIVDRLGLF